MLRSLLAAALVIASLSGCPSAEGPQGPQGPQGPAGPKGDPGATGMTGEQGPQGPAGMTGSQGPTGPQGVQGPAGMVLVIDGGVVTGPPGSSVLVSPIAVGVAPCLTGGVRITQLSDGGVTNVCNGDRGPQGMAGPQGPQGMTGPQGPQGMTGSIGPQGPAGVAGPALSATSLPSMSPQCATGGVLVGLADGGSLALCNGAPGTQGIQGIQGVAGPQGPAGDAGVQGPAGPAGPTGGTGPAGPIGPTGPSGPMGPPGSVLYLDGGVVVSDERWVRFVGYTTATFNGNLGGIPGANAKCRAEYPGSTFCTTTDFAATEPDQSMTPGAPFPWIDGARDSQYRRQGTSCGTWTSASGSTVGGTLNASGQITGEYCNVVRRLACCAVPIKRTIRGVTVATFNGNLGGIPGANSKCRAEFPGSFFCTTSDFNVAETSTFLVTPYPWIDGARDDDGRRSGTSCGTWSSASGSTVGGTMGVTGTITGEYCNVIRPLICCQ
jgi:hypothetical protein